MYNLELELNQNLSVNFDRKKTLQSESLFKIARFEVRKIHIEANYYHNHVHSFLISGSAGENEMIVLSLIENGRGTIQTIKSYTFKGMDKELSVYLIEAALDKLKNKHKIEWNVIKIIR